MKSFKLKNRALAAVLCLGMVGAVVSTFFLKDTEQAAATESLSGIVALKNSNTEYNILEIVPDVSQSAFAWYIGDAEAVNSRKLSSAYGSDTNTLVSKYQETTELLQGQNYLLPTAESDEPGDSILRYMGSVSPSGVTVTGGFENNEWFQRYVLDWNDGEDMARIKMTTLSPENVTVAHISLADMVIISGGYYYPDNTVTPMAYSSEEGKNLKTEVADAIISGVNQGLSVILDRRAYGTEVGSSMESNRVFLTLLGEDPRVIPSGVYGSVFYYSSFATGEEAGNSVNLADGSTLGIVGSLSQGYLVTPQFHQAFDASMTSVGAPFADVLASIQAENSTRNSFNQVLLSEEITMARVVQYLISGSASKTVSSSKMKETVQVLSIQPGNSDDIARYTAAVHDVFGLSQPTVTAQVGLPVDASQPIMSDQVSWDLLESWTGVSRENIHVVEMSVKDFAMQPETVTSLYDMVYIGNDISGGSYGLYSESSVFNAGGLGHASEGTQTYFATMGEELSKPGYSYASLVNDISVTKYNELLDFVKAGRPVVIAPYLCAGLNWKTDKTSPSSITVDMNSNMYSFLEKIQDQSGVYRQDSLIVGQDGIAGNMDDSAMYESLVERVHIPTAQVEFATLSASVPPSYGDEASWLLSGDQDNELSYIFKISSLLDKSIYRLYLSLDLDGDGVYEVPCNSFEDFEITQLQTDISGNLVLNQQQVVRERNVEADELSQEQYYGVSVTLPEWVEGVVPWQIQVVSLSDSSVATMVEEITYVRPASQRTLSVLQVYGAGEVSMESSSTYQQLLGNVSGSGAAQQLLDDMNIVVYSVSVDTFNAMVAESSSNLSGYHNNMVSYAAGLGYNASVYRDGSQSLLGLLDKYDLLVIGSGEVSSALSTEGKSFIESYIGWNRHILFSDSNMNVSDLPFYGGKYSGSATRLSMGSTKLNQMNTRQFQNYPYEIEVAAEQFTLSEGNVYYTNVAISEDVNDGKIMVNTLSSVMTMSDVEYNWDSERSSPINFWLSNTSNELVGNTFNYYRFSKEGSSTSTVESSRYIYFSLPGTADSKGNDAYFTLENLDETDTLQIPYFYRLVETTVDGNTTMVEERYVFSDRIPDLNSRYYIHIPDEFLEENGTKHFELQAHYSDSSGEVVESVYMAGNNLYIKVTPFVSSDEVVDMFYTNDDGIFVNLLPQG